MTGILQESTCIIVSSIKGFPSLYSTSEVYWLIKKLVCSTYDTNFNQNNKSLNLWHVNFDIYFMIVAEYL